MVELVYGQLDDETLSAAILKMPGCDAGVSHDRTRQARNDTGCQAGVPLSIVNSVEESFGSRTFEVPRDGVEPPTRGFSGLMEMAPKGAQRKVKLRAV